MNSVSVYKPNFVLGLSVLCAVFVANVRTEIVQFNGSSVSVAYVGDTIHFHCGTNGSAKIRWYFYTESQASPQIVFTGVKLVNSLDEGKQQRYKFSDSGSLFKMINVQTEDAGRYQCLPQNSQKQIADFQLSVQECQAVNSNIGKTVGSKVCFSCSTKNATIVKWLYQESSTDPPRVIYTGSQLSDDSKYSIRHDNTSVNITIHNVQTTDTGTYICRDLKSSDVLAIFNLITEDENTNRSAHSTLPISPDSIGRNTDIMDTYRDDVDTPSTSIVEYAATTNMTKESSSSSSTGELNVIYIMIGGLTIAVLSILIILIKWRSTVPAAVLPAATTSDDAVSSHVKSSSETQNAVNDIDACDNTAPGSPSVSGSKSSIDHYSEITEEPYEGLDGDSVVRMATLPPPIYSGLSATEQNIAPAVVDQ